MAEINPRTTWFGVGQKFGGTMIAGRIESTSGFAINLLNPAWNNLWSIEKQGAGLGLGGGTTSVCMFVFNAPSLMALDHMAVSGFDVAVSVGAKLSTIIAGLAKLEKWKKLYPIAKDLAVLAKQIKKNSEYAENIRIVGKLTAEHLAQIKEAGELLHKQLEIKEAETRPSIVALDVPLTGYGVEVGVTWLTGYFNIL